MCSTRELVIKGYHWDQKTFINLDYDIFYLAINMSSKCNFKCPYCFVGLDNLVKRQNELTFNEMRDIIKNGKELGANVIVMPGKGEPLVDSNFWRILEFITELDLWCVVYTNGYYLDPEKIEKLNKLNVSLYLKTDSFSPEIYEEMVGISKTYSKFSENLNCLLENFQEVFTYGDRLVTRLGMNSVVTKQTSQSIKEIYSWCKENNIYYTCRSPVNVGEASKNWNALVGENAIELKQLGEKYAARQFTSATEIGQCGIYRYGMTIDNNGDVFVCPDAHDGCGFVGNIRESSLIDLYRLKNDKFPPNNSPGFCFVKSIRNQEESI